MKQDRQLHAKSIQALTLAFLSKPYVTPGYLPENYIVDTNICFQVLDSQLCAS